MTLIETGLSLEEAVRRAAAEPGSVGFEYAGQTPNIDSLVFCQGLFFRWKQGAETWPLAKADFDLKFNLYDLRPEDE